MLRAKKKDAKKEPESTESNVPAAAEADIQQADHEDILLMLDRLANGDFTPPDEHSDSDLGRSIENVRVALGRVTGRAGVMANELREEAARVGKFAEDMCKNSTALDAEDIISSSRDVLKNLNAMASAAEQVSVNMSTVAERAASSKESIATIENTTTELTSASREIASNTDKARVISAKAVTDMESAANKFQELESAAEEISKVTNTITEVSDQTKLLALNATIEAARAGDAGRGFAVVASEVKELASQTNDANRDIKAKIDIIQDAIVSTVKSIMGVSAVISEVNEIVSTIAAAAEQQSLATADISQNLGAATTLTGEMSDSVAEGARAIDEMRINLTQAADGSGDITGVLEHLADEQKVFAEYATTSYAEVAELERRSEDLAAELNGLVADSAIASVSSSD